MVAGLIGHDVIAGNLANVDTPGYKRDMAITGSFQQEMIRSLRRSQRGTEVSTTPIGFLGYGAYVHSIGSDHSQGPLIETQGTLDLGIDGDGYFVVRSPSGDLLTRSGAFKLSPSGMVTTMSGMSLLGMSGPMVIPPEATNIEILADGTVYVDDRVHDRLRIASLDNPEVAEKVGDGLFRVPQGSVRQAGSGSFVVRQGFLEMSNVDSISEMARMIAGMRTYEACQKMIWAIDQTLDKTVNDVGRVA
jgi:flagellar basal-body rod protein FlgF